MKSIRRGYAHIKQLNAAARAASNDLPASQPALLPATTSQVASENSPERVSNPTAPRSVLFCPCGARRERGHIVCRACYRAAGFTIQQLYRAISTRTEGRKQLLAIAEGRKS
jgi:hypothetical protein